MLRLNKHGDTCDVLPLLLLLLPPPPPLGVLLLLLLPLPRPLSPQLNPPLEIKQ